VLVKVAVRAGRMRVRLGGLLGRVGLMRCRGLFLSRDLAERQQGGLPVLVGALGRAVAAAAVAVAVAARTFAAAAAAAAEARMFMAAEAAVARAFVVAEAAVVARAFMVAAWAVGRTFVVVGVVGVVAAYG
jgi:hypothetical protein